jgi:hypothetical protein
MVRTPFGRTPSGQFRRVVVPVLVVNLLAWVPFALIPGADKMVRLQSAGSRAKAGSILAGWTASEAIDVTFLVGIDFIHLLAYAVLLSAGAAWAGRRLHGRLARVAPAVGWAAFAAAGADVLENAGLITMIRGHIEDPLPAFAAAMTLVKSSLIAVAAMYVLIGAIAGLRRRDRAQLPA